VLSAELDNRASWSRYTPALPALERASLACVGAGEQLGPIAPFSDRSLDTHGLVVVSGGVGSFTSAGRTARVESPALIWLFPGVLHGYGPDWNGWAEHWLLFSGVGASVYEGLGLVHRSRPVVQLEHVPFRLTSLFGLLRHELGGTGPRAALRSSVTAQNILEAAIIAAVGNRRPREASSIVSAIEAGAFGVASVEQRAQSLHISPDRLRQAVREETGMTTVDFVVNVRLVRARELLAGTRVSIGEVARAVGYDDPAYFSRLFALRTGISPSRFRQQQYRAAASAELPGEARESIRQRVDSAQGPGSTITSRPDAAASLIARPSE
jgi:AraC-like DNA-binding protein